MPAAVAYQMVKDMRQLDANPRLNLASFCTTWMEPEAEKLIAESLNVNFVDMEIYPSSTEIANRCSFSGMLHLMLQRCFLNVVCDLHLQRCSFGWLKYCGLPLSNFQPLL